MLASIKVELPKTSMAKVGLQIFLCGQLILFSGAINTEENMSV